MWQGRCGFAVEEVARRSGDFALAGVVAAVELDDAGAVAALGDLVPRHGAHAGARAAPPRPALNGTVAQRAPTSPRSARLAVGRHRPDRRRARVGRVPHSTSARTSWSAPSTEPWEQHVVAEHAITFTVNGEAHSGRAEARKTLADFLREDCALTGTHLGCEHGVCGACTILVDGEAVRSCLMFAVQAEGADITTIEGIGPADGSLGPVQEAFRQAHGLQCGFCTPGLRRQRARVPRSRTRTRRSTRSARASPGNLCRCTGYQGIIKAVQIAAESMSAKSSASNTSTQTTLATRRRPDGALRSDPRRRAASGAVIVIQEAFGVNDHIQDVARRFAAAGLPRGRAGALPPRRRRHRALRRLQKVMPLFEGVTDDGILADVDATIAHLDGAGFAAEQHRHRRLLLRRPGHVPRRGPPDARRRGRVLRRRHRRTPAACRSRR